MTLDMTTPPRDTAWGLILGIVAVGVGALIVSPLLKDLSTATGTPVDRMGWVVAVYGLTLAVTAPPMALWCRSVPRRTLLIAGMALLGAATVACALASTLGQLLLARAACGVAAGVFIPSCYAWIGENVPAERRAQAMGRVMAGWSLALVLGIPAGGWLAEALGWRAAFVGVGALAATATWTLRHLPAEAGHGSSPEPIRHNVGRVARPGPVKVLGINLMNMFAFYACYTYLGWATRDALGVGSGVAGSVVMCYGIGLMLSTLNGHWLDRIGHRRSLAVAVWCLVLVFAALPLGLFHLAALGGVMVVWGVFQGAAQTCTATLMARQAPGAQGLAMACLSATTYLGVALGAAAGGWVMPTQGFAAVAAISAVATAIGGGVVHWLGNERPHRAEAT